MKAKAFIQMYPMDREKEDGSMQRVTAIQTDFFMADGNSFMAFAGSSGVDELGYTELEGIAQAFEMMAVATRQLHEQYEEMKFPGLDAPMPSEDAAKKYN